LRALDARPPVKKVTDKLGARLESAHFEFGRWYFVFESRDPKGFLTSEGFVSTECRGGTQKGDRVRPACWKRQALFSGFKLGRLVMADEDSSYDALRAL